MGQQVEQGQPKHKQGGPDGTHVEHAGLQLGQEAAVHGLVDQGAEARFCHAQRDQADLATLS